MSTTPKPVTQRNIMRKASQIQFFFMRIWQTVAALSIKPHPAMQFLRHLGLGQAPRALLASLCVLTIALVSSYAEAAPNQNKRWYRYYDDRGVPMISGSVSEQHMLHGYDVLDSTLNVLRHVPPFSTSKYAQEEHLRAQAIERRIADRHLIETYVSSSRAATQRDRELGDLDSQIKRSEQQSEGLSTTLNGYITRAAGFERQGNPVPPALHTQLTRSRTMLAQSESNIAALKAKREATEQQFNRDIATLKRIEQQGSSATAPLPTSRAN